MRDSRGNKQAGSHRRSQKIDADAGGYGKQNGGGNQNNGSHIHHASQNHKFLLGQFLLMADRLYHQTYGHVQDALYQSHSQLVMDICGFIQEHMQEEDVLAADSLAKKLPNKHRIFG